MSFREVLTFNSAVLHHTRRFCIDFCESKKDGTRELDFSQESGNTVFLSYISISGQVFHKRQWLVR